MRAGVQGELKNGAKVVFDPDLGNVVSLEASEAWLLMGDFKGIYVYFQPIAVDHKCSSISRMFSCQRYSYSFM